MGRYSPPKCVVSEKELNMMSARRSGSKYVVEKMNLITVHLLEYQEVKILGQTGKVLGPLVQSSMDTGQGKSWVKVYTSGKVFKYILEIRH